MIFRTFWAHLTRCARYSLIITLSLIAAIPQSLRGAALDPSMQFNLTDADIKALGLSDTEAQQFKQFFDELNNMSPAQKKQLEDFGRQTEEKMRQKGLDPTNMDDLMKYMEDEGAGMVPQAKKPTLQKPDLKPSLVEPAIEKPMVVAVASPTSTLKMLQDISKYIASFRQKAVTHPAMMQKLDAMNAELSELTTLLPLLKTADLITLLSSKEFMFLHENFESLHKALATYEPSIIAQKKALFDENDPYEVLGVAYDASQEAITERYNALKASDSPAVIEAHLKKEKVPAKSIKKQVKRARVSFGFIERAYKTLKSPKSRAEVDKTLHQKIQKATKREAASMSAFNNIYSALSGRVRSQLIPSIKQLLERYKPQEMAKAREQMALEQRAYERSKQIIKIPQMMPRENFGPGPYEEFYRKMAQESYMRPQLPQQRMNGGMPGTNGAAPKGPEKTEAAGGGEKPKAGGDKGKGGGDKGGKDKDAAKEGKLPKADEGKKEEPLEYKKMESLGGLISLLEKASAEKDTVQIRSGPLEGEQSDGEAEDKEKAEEKKLPLPNILNSLTAELGGMRGAADKPADSARHLDLFYQKRQLPAIKEGMKSITKLLIPEKGKKVPEQLKKLYKEHIFNPYGSMIKSWHDMTVPVLAQQGMDQKLSQKYNLNRPLPNMTPQAPPSGKEQEPASGFTNLGAIRDDLYVLNHYFNQINTSLGLTSPPPVMPVKPKKKFGE